MDANGAASTKLTPAPIDNIIGLKLGDYLVEELVAWGGIGVVYRAVQPLIGRRVAIKVLRAEMANNPEQVERFLKEAQALSAIKHRAIIDNINFGHLPDGRQYMVMEFLEGEPLDKTMVREGAMAPIRALQLIDEVLDALSAAHNAGVVHRDLKPSNVFLALQSNNTQYVKLLDFGLAKQTAISGADSPAFARASVMAGTPEYISPEQARGLAATPRSDLYCLGVMLFEMLTGRLPFIGRNIADTLRMQVADEAPRLRSISSLLPASLDALTAQLLEKDPEKRPRSAQEVRREIQGILRELHESVTIVRPFPEEPQPTRVHEAPLPAAALPSGGWTGVERRSATGEAHTVAQPPAPIAQPLEPRPPTRSPARRRLPSGWLLRLGLGFGLVGLGLAVFLAVRWRAQRFLEPAVEVLDVRADAGGQAPESEVRAFPALDVGAIPVASERPDAGTGSTAEAAVDRTERLRSVKPPRRRPSCKRPERLEQLRRQLDGVEQKKKAQAGGARALKAITDRARGLARVLAEADDEGACKRFEADLLEWTRQGG